MEPNRYTGPERRKHNIPATIERRAEPATDDNIRQIIDERRDTDPEKSHTIRNPGER